MKAELKRAADLVAFQRREALSRKRLSGDPRNPFRPRYGAELTFAAASQEAETLGYYDRERPHPRRGVRPCYRGAQLHHGEAREGKAHRLRLRVLRG